MNRYFLEICFLCCYCARFHWNFTAEFTGHSLKCPVFLAMSHTSRNKTKIHFSVTIFVVGMFQNSSLNCSVYVTMSSFCSHLTSCNRRKSHLSVTPIWNFIVGIFPNSSPHCTNFLMNLQHFCSRPKHQEPKLKTPAISLR